MDKGKKSKENGKKIFISDKDLIPMGYNTRKLLKEFIDSLKEKEKEKKEKKKKFIVNSVPLTINETIDELENFSEEEIRNLWENLKKKMMEQEKQGNLKEDVKKDINKIFNELEKKKKLK